jgi:CRISPR-associated protein Csb1
VVLVDRCNLDPEAHLVNPQQLLDRLSKACRGGMTAVRVVTRLAPVGGDGDKVFPPTYEGGKYATEKRRVDGHEVEAVLLDSVQSQANRMEAALLEAVRAGECKIPLLQVTVPRGPGETVVTALDAPHRAFDAIFRDSLLDGKKFRDSPLGKRLVGARLDNATALFEACPTALIFGVWDSTGGGGVTGTKVARAVISEIVGLKAVYGRKSSSRIDPLAIPRDAAVIYRSEADFWTLSPDEAVKDKKGNPEKLKSGRPSEINHGNVLPSVSTDGQPGGVTISEAVQTTVLSFPQLRRLRFPDPESGKAGPERDLAGRAVLAALALYAIARQREEGYSLRSRCHLVPVEPARYEFLGSTAKDVEEVDMPLETIRDAFALAVKQAGKVGLTWREGVIDLKPAAKLVELVRRGDEKAAVEGGE